LTDKPQRIPSILQVSNIGRGVQFNLTAHRLLIPQLKPLSVVRHFADKCESPRRKKVKALQTKFQNKLGKCPVYLAGGGFDKMLYYLTWIMCWLGMSISVIKLLKMAI